MSQLDDIVAYARNNARERERSAAEHRLAHEAVAGSARFGGARQLLSLRRRARVPAVEEPQPRPEMRQQPR